ALARLVADLVPGQARSAFDEPWPFPMLPTEVDGWSGRPGLAGHRDGRNPYPRLVVYGQPAVAADADGAQVLTARAGDGEAGLEVVAELRLEACGLLRVRHTLTNAAAGPYTVA